MTSAQSPIVGVFEGRREAETAVGRLLQAGFRPEQVGVVLRDEPAGKGLAKVVADVAPEEGAAVGAVTGGTLGGLIGAAVAATLPGVGPALAVGILAGALGGATVGTAGGGLVGALVGLGMSHEEASYFEAEFHRGRALVSVRADGRRAEAAEILARCGAYPRAEGPPG
jgi:hypothetical protein